MTLVSYAQNFEDVLLWRALKHVPNGVYIDVGAQDPVIDSVSLAFYEHGWRGVHIEPTAKYAEKLRLNRPDEVVIEAAIGSSPGSLRFFEIPDTGLSTCDPEVAERHRAEGLSVTETIVPCLTLTQALEPYSDRDVHWMKIDVEGFEREVIEGWDAASIRPWILVIESTEPGSPIVSHQEWEPLVLARGYCFSYFDGLNRFYVANERSSLGELFDRPPNYFDDFVLSGSGGTFTNLLNEKLLSRDGEISRLVERAGSMRDELGAARRAISVLESEANRLSAELASLAGNLAERERALVAKEVQAEMRESEWDRAKGDLAEAQRQIGLRDAEANRLKAHIAWQEREWSGVKSELASALQQLAARSAELDSIERSRSWKITRPLRLVNQARRSAAEYVCRVARRVQQIAKAPANERPRQLGLWLVRRPHFLRLVHLTLAPFPGMRRRLDRHLPSAENPPAPLARIPRSTVPPVSRAMAPPKISSAAAGVLRDLKDAMSR